MQMHVSEASDREGNLPARFAQGSQAQKMPFKLGSTFDDGERGAASVTFSEELLQVVRHAKGTNFEHLWTSDES
jgi:hypothetical protein